jgi:ribokinase
MAGILVSGAINWDTTLFVDELPTAGKEIRVKSIINVPGGKGANTAVAAARMLHGTDSNVAILGALGNDTIGDEQMSILKDEGVDVSCVNRLDAHSGQAYILVDSKGENMILTYKAANDILKPEILEEGYVESMLSRVNYVVVIDPPLDFAKALIDKARVLNKQIAWMPAMLTRHGLDALMDSIGKVDYLVLNEHELYTLTSGDTIDALRSIKARRVILTLGSKGCILHTSMATFHIPALDVTAIGMKVKSSVGAGDTLLGSFIASLARGYGELESLFIASIAAALKVTRVETRGSPYYKDVVEIMKNPVVERLAEEIRAT